MVCRVRITPWRWRQISVNLQATRENPGKLQVIFRLFNDAIAFRYEWPEQSAPKDFAVMDELTEFVFPADQAGCKGYFGLVIGVARENNVHELKTNGADFVVEDLLEINVDDINKWICSKQGGKQPIQV
jgi:hypothetical protein